MTLQTLVPEKDVLSFWVLTDPHLFHDPNGDLMGIPTWQSFRATEAVLDAPADAWLLTGDLAQDHKKETYQMLKTHLGDKPWFWVPGNHDDPQAMVAVFGPQVRRLRAKHWQVLLLSSHDPGQVSGWLSDAELAFVEQCASEDLHTLVVVHHHPKPCGSCWLDHHQLRNGQDLLARLAKYPKAKAVLYGHIHQEVDEMVSGVRLLASPSTCVQFKPNSQDFAVDETAPGCRYLQLLPDGRIDTRILRLADGIFSVDAAAGGY
ncbi:3',5'-cyclic-AMP phosphodiesterase [Gallaecimonas mangrovi]|uniref:3',5'-cyclic-AMP phosphodiesterase n=1 Tax=Gallaecimonas mangrovi TaxID=2291597 RepID=UPI000E20A383|nr:3',5'-cyclic-AMP phosphodiesterase [Gallaecimonas mangrovi]